MKSMKRQKILVVDDIPEVYQRIESSLNRVCDLEYAQTLKKGLERIRDNAYSGVITDFDLDGSNSIELIKASKNRGLPVIVMSKENVRERVIKAGADKFIFKKDLFKKLETSGLDCFKIYNER